MPTIGCTSRSQTSSIVSLLISPHKGCHQSISGRACEPVSIQARLLKVLSGTWARYLSRICARFYVHRINCSLRLTVLLCTAKKFASERYRPGSVK